MRSLTTSRSRSGRLVVQQCEALRRAAPRRHGRDPEGDHRPQPGINQTRTEFHVNQLVERKLDDLARLCEKFRVKRLDLFGSATTDLFDPQTSDLDFLVSLQEMDFGEYANAYFGLLEGLQELFDRHIDLVMESAINNPYFRQEVEATRMALYAA